MSQDTVRSLNRGLIPEIIENSRKCTPATSYVIGYQVSPATHQAAVNADLDLIRDSTAGEFVIVNITNNLSTITNATSMDIVTCIEYEMWAGVGPTLPT